MAAQWSRMSADFVDVKPVPGLELTLSAFTIAE